MAILSTNPINFILTDSISVKYKDASKNSMNIAKTISIVPPVVTNVSGNHIKVGDIFDITWLYFGESLPAIHVEYYTEKSRVKSYARKKMQGFEKGCRRQKSTALYKCQRQTQ